jgi:hypothetical protein
VTANDNDSENAALAAAIDTSARWMERAGSLVDGVEVPANERNRVAVALLHLCMEHHTGVHVLVERRLWGSAFALLRSQFEAFVRGAWFQRCATDAEIARFLRRQDPPKIDKQIAALEECGAFEPGSLSDLKRTAWKSMNDYTHGGATQVKARNTVSEIAQNFLPSHMAEVLDVSAMFAFQACVRIAGATDSEILVSQVRDAYRPLYEKSRRG